MAAIRHQVRIAAPARVVWHALTTEDGLRGWWGEADRLDPRAGGRFVITVDDGLPAQVPAPPEEGDAPDEDGAEDAPAEAAEPAGPVQRWGVFHSFRPTRSIEITWDSGLLKGTRLAFQLGRDEDETKVHIVQSVSGGLDDDALRDALETWWKAALLRLRDGIEAA